MSQKDNVEDLAEKRARLRASGGEWRVHLLASKTEQQPRPMLANALLALRDAPEWRGVIGYDDFSLTIMLLRPPPWQRGPLRPWPLEGCLRRACGGVDAAPRHCRE